MKRQILVALAAASLFFAACGSDTNSTASTASTAAPSTTAGPTETTAAPTTTAAVATAASCAKGKTLAADTLTIATGNPAFPPYVIDDKPESGQGFEAALALAVAKDLGFEGDKVKWVRTDFDSIVAGNGTDAFDFNLQQFSINADRQKVVSFSDPYYTANQAVLGYTDGPGKNVKTVADLKKLKLGAASGTTSLQFITDVIKPTAEAFAFNSNADAKTALDNKTIDAIITDLPTSLFISSAGSANGGIDNTQVFGQFPIGDGGAGESWGLLFKKDNPLVECANLALKALKDSGDLDKITQQWMGDYTKAPVLPAS
jgi:polar amino acid transport system substrate-binding protein